MYLTDPPKDHTIPLFIFIHLRWRFWNFTVWHWWVWRVVSGDWKPVKAATSPHCDHRPAFNFSFSIFLFLVSGDLFFPFERFSKLQPLHTATTGQLVRCIIRVSCVHATQLIFIYLINLWTKSTERERYLLQDKYWIYENKKIFTVVFIGSFALLSSYPTDTRQNNFNIPSIWWHFKAE